VYGALTVAELLDEVYEQLKQTKDGDELYQVQEKLGILQ
jgi:hypothetical protein